MRASRALLLLSVLVLGCGSRSQLLEPYFDAPPSEQNNIAPNDVPDAFDAMDVIDVVDVTDVVDVRDVDVLDACVPVRDLCRDFEVCGNGEDDNCDGRVDENCRCTPGLVQSCFGGPPGRRNIGSCRDGTQVCRMDSTWGACEGGINPRPDVCNGQDNLCNGCSRQLECPIMCPGPGDPRVRDGAPLREYPLNGRTFYQGPVRSWRWSIRGGACDQLSPTRPTYELRNPNSENAVFFPRLSGDYTVTLTVIAESGRELTCTWLVHVEGLGLRIEMCYPENTTLDADLYLSRPGTMTPWFRGGAGSSSGGVTPDSCGWHNCEAMIRGSVGRANWGYMPSPLIECESGPQGDQWRTLGFCSNPRLDIDNNLSEGTGLPENINVDRPRDNETFRIMVHNFSGPTIRPLVNVYCSGRRVATYGAPPDVVANFTGRSGNSGIGAVWRAADVTARVDSTGRTMCTTRQVPRYDGRPGYNVTYDDGQF